MKNAKDNLFKDLTIFRTVVETQSYSAAADKLNINISSVSRRISALEEHFGKQLIIRNTRNTLITAEGTKLYNAFIDHEQNFLMMLETFQESNWQFDDIINISIPNGFMEHVLAENLPTFLQENPGITINLNVQSHEINVISEQYDFAILRQVPKQNQLKVRKLFQISVHLYCSMEYAKIYGVPETLEDLTKHLVVSRISDKNKPIEYVHATKGNETTTIKCNFKLTTSSFATDKLILMSHKAIVAGTDYFYRDRLAANEIIKVLPEYIFAGEHSTFYLASHNNKHRSKAVEKLINFIIQTLHNIENETTEDKSMEDTEFEKNEKA